MLSWQTASFQCNVAAHSQLHRQRGGTRFWSAERASAPAAPAAPYGSRGSSQSALVRRRPSCVSARPPTCPFLPLVLPSHSPSRISLSHRATELETRFAQAGARPSTGPAPKFAGLEIPNDSAERRKQIEREALGDVGAAADPSVVSRDRSGKRPMAPPPPPPPRRAERPEDRPDDERAVPGRIYAGKVSNVMDFGCFIQVCLQPLLA